MIFFAGLLYRLSLKTAVRLPIHLQYYPHHMMPIIRVPCFDWYKREWFINIWRHILVQSEIFAKISPSSSIGDICKKFRHRLQLQSSSLCTSLYISNQTQIFVFIHILNYDILELFVGWIIQHFFISFIFIYHPRLRHLLHTLKQTQIFVFIHILQYVILEVCCRITFQ